MEWLSAAEALHLLGTQPQTLYANVSRGRIKARPDPADSRRSLYRGDDVRRLAQRAAGRRKQEQVAADAMNWGEPVLETAISTIRAGRLFYRGQDACALAEHASLEEAASLLWQRQVSPLPSRHSHATPGLAAAFQALAAHAADPAQGQYRNLRNEAETVFATLADALAGPSSETAALHIRLASLWHCPDAADIIRRALVLLADHELNASTFAARITVSTGASLWSGTLAALATLTGPRHGRASRQVAALALDIGHPAETAEAELMDWLGEGREIPGIGHPLYPEGDPRSAALLSAFAAPPAFLAYAGAAESISADKPNIDFALAALVARFDLPADAALTIFSLARSIGWLAHMIEQVEQGRLIRPRARYVGPSP